jgi:hypothetical protein
MLGLFYSFWWLIFPLFGFAMVFAGMLTSYLTQRERLKIIQTYAAQGKDPAEVARVLGLQAGPADSRWSGGVDPAAAPNPAYYWGPGYRRYWRRWGPYRDWRTFITMACVSGGFYWAASFTQNEDSYRAFYFVSIITGVIAAGALAMAILSTVLRCTLNPPPPPAP